MEITFWGLTNSISLVCLNGSESSVVNSLLLTTFDLTMYRDDSTTCPAATTLPSLKQTNNTWV